MPEDSISKTYPVGAYDPSLVIENIAERRAFETMPVVINVAKGKIPVIKTIPREKR